MGWVEGVVNCTLLRYVNFLAHERDLYTKFIVYQRRGSLPAKMSAGYAMAIEGEGRGEA